MSITEFAKEYNEKMFGKINHNYLKQIQSFSNYFQTSHLMKLQTKMI